VTIKRREFITLLGGSAAWPLAARAQQGAMPVIGFLDAGLPDQRYAAAFRKGLNETGYVEGQNVTVEYHWLEGQYDRLPALAADLVRRRMAVIAAGGNVAVLAAKAATTTIPIVFRTGNDPVQTGLVASLNRPGSNLTGVSMLNSELAPKRLELLHELVPTATPIALLINSTNPPNPSNAESFQAAARALGLQLAVVQARSERDFDAVFATLVQLQAGALMISSDGLFIGQSDQLGALTLQHAMPTVFQYREFAAAGGLMSYGGSLTDSGRLAGIYTGRILKGEKPADLPVIQSTKVELIINLKTAKMLGITVPLALLTRADEVIE
jgi:putative tryptophan/tyrosine transport system substrate-binding protein